MDFSSILKKITGGANLQPNAKPGNVLSGVRCGFLMLFFALVVVYLSVVIVKEESAIIAGLPLQAASEVSSDARGLVKVCGQLHTDEAVDLEVELCFDKFCDFAGDQEAFRNLFYYDVVFERYEVIR